MLKRTLDSLNPVTPERSNKRRHLSFDNPFTPARSSPSAAYSYPYLSSSPVYPLKPDDSPSNPFGRRRTLSSITSLPEPTRFRKHIGLRFQLVTPNERRYKEGCHRIVQVPLSYTFLHLRCLIAFLFGGHNPYTPLPELNQGGSKKNGEGHLFEVIRRPELYNSAYRPGSIKKGVPTVRLSSCKNPYEYKEEWDFDDDLSDTESCEGDQHSDSDTGKEAEAPWRWEAEEEYTIGNVWEKGALDAGIIYHHAYDAGDTKRFKQVHITVANASSITNRSGCTNVPWVYQARGHAFLNPPQNLGRRIHSSKPEEGAHADESFVEDLDIELDPNLWNEPEDKFEDYFLQCTAGSSSSTHRYDDKADDFSSSPAHYPSTPGLTCGSSSSIDLFSSPSPLKSSPNPFASNPALTRFKAPTKTPAPGQAQKKRLRYMQKKIEKSKRRIRQQDKVASGESDCGEAEGAELDQLADDDESKNVAAAPKKGVRLFNAVKKAILPSQGTKVPPHVKAGLHFPPVWQGYHYPGQPREDDEESVEV